MVKDLQKAEEVRLKKRRERGRDGDEGDVTYINDKNKQFNQKLARFYNKVCAVVKAVKAVHLLTTDDNYSTPARYEKASNGARRSRNRKQHAWFGVNGVSLISYMITGVALVWIERSARFESEITEPSNGTR